MTVQADNLLEASANSITHDCPANFLRYGKAKSTVHCPMFGHKNEDMSCSDAMTTALGAKKMLSLSQSKAAWEPKRWCAHFV